MTSFSCSNTTQTQHTHELSHAAAETNTKLSTLTHKNSSTYSVDLEFKVKNIWREKWLFIMKTISCTQLCLQLSQLGISLVENI